MGDWLSTPNTTVLLLGLAVAASMVAYALVGRFRLDSPDGEADPVQRIAVNSAIPIISQLFIRGVDLAVAIVLLRLLGPSGNGQYALAVVVWLYVKTISDFGLSLLATREIARDHSRLGRLVGVTTFFRLLVLTVTSLPVAGYLVLGSATGTLTRDSTLAIVLLLVSIVPSSYTEAVNAALNGLERMALAAFLNMAVGIVRAPLAIAAGANLDVPGVALAAVVAAVLSADLYRRTLAGLGFRVNWSLSWADVKWLTSESWPLLVNGLLVSLFFRLDVFVIQAFRGDRALGLYDAAYKLINLVTIIPAYATLALFPAMSQRATDPASLQRMQRLASSLLVWIAWLIVVVTTAGSEFAIRLLAGDDYLPASATLLRVLIWFAPLSFINGIAQYVLVAAGLQRRLVPAFIAAVVFNLVANLAFVPAYGTHASAAITVVTEIVILFALVRGTRSSIVPAIPSTTLRSLWRPTVVGVVSAAAALILVRTLNEAAAVPIALAAFLILSAVLKVFGEDERRVLQRALGRSQRAYPESPSNSGGLP